MPSLLILGIRTLLVCVLTFVIINRHPIQVLIDGLWQFMRQSWIFQSVYFETWYVTMMYAILMIIPATLDRFAIFDRFKINPKVKFEHPSISLMLVESVIYMTPLGILDTFMVKKYDGVPGDTLASKRRNWIQQTRALPTSAPTVIEILVHLAISILIFDLIFFCFHMMLHRNAWLYKMVHSDHHDHKEGLQARVTNKLTLVERITLILTANFSLKVILAHPLTRVIYVPLFLWLLIENHWGYDFPWSVDKICPFGIMGGSRHHYEHHVNGARNYEPFFTYLDAIHRWTQMQMKNIEND